MKQKSRSARAQSDRRLSPTLVNSESSPKFRLPGLPVPGTGSVVVCPLSGVADIGMNWTLYGYAGGYILVDAGSGFAPREVEGVEAVFPDPEILRGLGKRLLGLVVTHFHEDHVGAIHRVFPDFASCPIYAPPFASEMLKLRLRETDTLGEVKVRTFNPGTEFKLGHFLIRTIPVAHSTPDCVALFLRTPVGNILHTGDWKIDPNPGVGRVTDLSKFEAIGREGVDLMLCDSTNADREAPQTTEADVRKAFAEIFRNSTGMVVVSSFGSNVARMGSVAQAAKETHRYVALAGHSLRRAEEVATKLKLLGDVRGFLSHPKYLRDLDRRQQVLMCTGTQGEERAALTRLASGIDLKLPAIQPGDIVVHSARIIPGNEEYVGEVFAALRAQGATIITADQKFSGNSVHVTGHPCRPELRLMYAAVRPRCAIPVHGAPHHLEQHAELARAAGVASVNVPFNGAVYEMTRGRVAILGHLQQHYVAALADDEGSIVKWDQREQRPRLEDRHVASLATAAPAKFDPRPARGDDARHPRDQRPPRQEPRRQQQQPRRQQQQPRRQQQQPSRQDTHQDQRPARGRQPTPGTVADVGQPRPVVQAAQPPRQRPQGPLRDGPAADRRPDGQVLSTQVVFLKARKPAVKPETSDEQSSAFTM